MILKRILKGGHKGMDWIHVAQNKAKWGVGLFITCADEKAALSGVLDYL
jgi:hypothetical protein